MPAISVRDASPDGADKTGANSPAVAARAGSVVEPRPGASADPLERSLQQAVEQVFVSPRIVDQRAFDDFAGQLSKLTRDAGKAGESLAVTHGQVKALNDQLRGLMSDLTSKTDAAIKALPVIEAKAAKVQQLLTHVGNETAIAKARELRDGVAQELLAQRDGLVKQLIAEMREAVTAAAMNDLQQQMRERIAGEVSRQLGEAMATQLPRMDAAIGPVAAAPTLDTLGLDASLRETIADARAALARFEDQVRGLDERLEASALKGERIAQRAEEIEKSLEEAVLRATMKFETTVGQSEQRTEAVATEIAQQLLALRADAAKLVGDSHQTLAADRAALASERQAALDTLAAHTQRLLAKLEAVPAMSNEAIEAKARAAVEASSREAASALSQFAAEQATQLEQARGEALAAIQTAAATTHARAAMPSEQIERISTTLAAAEAPALSRDMLEQLQAATQHASQTHAHAAGLIARLESLAARAEETRVQLGERVVAAAHAADVIDERLTRATHGAPGPQGATRELVGLLHQAQVAGSQLHQLGAWITHLLHASEAMAQRLERAQRGGPQA